MSAVIFDGHELARKIEKDVAVRVEKLERILRMATVVFEEDECSLVYTRLKQEAAVRVGIEFSQARLSLNDPLARVHHEIGVNVGREDIAGILIQKPAKAVWQRVSGVAGLSSGFANWWQRVTVALDPVKDVDCLTRENLFRVYEGRWWLLPATVRAVVRIIAEIKPEWRGEGEAVSGLKLGGVTAMVVGRSEIVGKPLAAVLVQAGAKVSLCGVEMDYGALSRADLVISATGVPGLIRGEMIKRGAVVMDVGTPEADVEMSSVSQVASVVTPVPGGVGPVTVACLMENMVDLVRRIARY